MNWNILENRQKIVSIPVGKMSVKNSEKHIKKLLKKWDIFFIENRKKKLDKIMKKIINNNV